MTLIVKKQYRSLEELIAYEVRALFRRQHLGRDVITGFVGDRGDGKSQGAAMVAIRDYMIAGEPCWSNMWISAEISVSDEDAWPFGLSGGSARYESIELDRERFLALDDEFHGGLVVTDEVNMEYGEALRSNSNVNLLSDRAGQQLRKLQTAWEWTCINEMWVDNRIRNLTDTFIRSRDTALNPEGLAAKKRPGELFAWTIYPMSRKLCGKTLEERGGTIGPIPVYGKNMWGVIDTYLRQAKGKMKYSAPIGGGMTASVEIQQSRKVVEETDKWGWLEPIANEISQSHEMRIPADDIYYRPEVTSRHVSPDMLSRMLNRLYGIQTIRASVGGRKQTFYEVDGQRLFDDAASSAVAVAGPA